MWVNTEVHSGRGVVAANPRQAAEIGARILEAGGNAMDAASGAGLACCMLQPHSTGIGGYCCSTVLLEGKSGRIWSVDANSPAPAAAHERMFEVVPKQVEATGINEAEFGCSVPGDVNVYGPLAVATPGMMAGLGIVWEKWGRLPWASIVAPSQQLLDDGFPYALVAEIIKKNEQLIRRFPATAAHVMPIDKVPQPEDIWHRPDMEKTLARLAEAGWRDFYDGAIGRRIADYIQGEGGILTREDMAAYEPRISEAPHIDYRDATVYTPAMPCGGITTLQALKMFECLDLPPSDTPEYFHLLAEVLKLVWRDRLRYLADPEFTDVPLERLLNAQYAMGRAETIRQFPQHVDRLDPNQPPGTRQGTLHVSAADNEGNLVAMTITHGLHFGSCVTVPGTGIILGHGMARFHPSPGHPNSIAPGKRPLHNMAALLIRLPQRDIATGIPGGRFIPSVMARTAQLLVERDATLHEVAIAPRLHCEGREPVLALNGIDPSVADGLKSMGHQVDIRDELGGCINSAEILKVDGGLRAGSGVSTAAVG